VISSIAREPNEQRECMGEVDASDVEQGRLSNIELTSAYIDGRKNRTTVDGPVQCVWTLIGPPSYRVTEKLTINVETTHYCLNVSVGTDLMTNRNQRSKTLIVKIFIL
jgi:hypothetical protein